MMLSSRNLKPEEYIQALLNEQLLHIIDLLFAEKWLQPFPEATKESFLFLAYLLSTARAGHLCVLIETHHLLPSLGPHYDAMVIAGAQQLPKPLFQTIVTCQENRWYLTRNWECETSFLTHLKRLKRSQPLLPISKETIQKKPAFKTLYPKQKAAIYKAISQSLSLICGGPGTGKTFTAAMLVALFDEQLNGEIVIAAPTGKATANIRAILETLSLSCQVQTLHSLLNGAASELSADLLLVDESSMVDAELMTKLFTSIKTGARLVLVGDPRQLPPVASGNLFADLADKKEPVTELTKCLRTERKEILDLAAQVRSGQSIAFHPLPGVKEIVEKIAEKLSLDSGLNEIAYQKFRALSALRQGPFGVDHLNALLFQNHTTHAKKKPISIPILITTNHPSLNLFNGETGFLVKEEGYAYFPGEKKIPEYLLPSYEYAYLLSVHKSQGSEYDSVLILLPPGSEVFGREMLYTAITRAKKEVEILSTEEVIKTLVATQSRRLSSLTSNEAASVI